MDEDKDSTQKIISEIIAEDEDERKKLRYGEIDIDNDEKKDITIKILKEINESIRLSRQQMDNIRAWQDLADGKVPPRTFPYDNASNLCLPILATKIRVATARFMKVLFPQSPIRIKGGTKDEIKKAPKAQEFLNRIIAVESKLKRVFRRMLRKVGRAGTCILKPYWVKETQMVKDIVEYDDLEKFRRDFPSAEKSGIAHNEYRDLIKKLGNGETVEFIVEYEDVKYQGVKVDIIDREDFIVPFGTIDSQDCLFNAQRIRRRWYQLKEMELDGIYENIDELLPRIVDDKGAIVDENREYVLYEVIRKYPAFKNNKKLPAHIRNKPVDCLFTIGIAGGTKPEYKDDLEGTATNAVYLRGEIYPFFHNRRFFIPFRTEEGDWFDGIGLGQKLYNLNIEANFFHNTRIDSLLIASTLSFKARRNSSLATEEQFWQPGGITWVDRMDDIEQFTVVPTGRDLVAEEQMMMRMCELHSGITDYASGKESATDPRAPAAKAMMMLQETNMSINEYVDTLRGSFSELAFQVLQLYFQFIPKEMEYQITGDKGSEMKKITRQELRMKSADFIVVGSTAEDNKYLDRQEFMTLVETMMKFPEVAQNPIARREILDRMLDKWEIKGKERIVPSEEDTEKAMMAMMKKSFSQQMDEKLTQMQGEGGGIQPPPVNMENMGGML